MDDESQLIRLGWNRPREAELERRFAGARPARIVNLSRGRYLAVSADGYKSGPVPRTDAPTSSWIAVGDWVALSADGRIQGLLKRTSLLSRKIAGKTTEEQLIAANVDYAFVVQGLDGDFNPRRLERTIAMIRSGGAQPVILLTKEDLASNLEEQVAEARSAGAGTPVYAVCAPRNQGIDVVRNLISAGVTAVFLGSSGAGKSTLLNALIGENVQRTAEVREADSRGRHTTTSRRMFQIPGGGMIIDNPGMREIQLWDAEEGVADTFPDIAELAVSCRFRDCRHESEPGCAVLEGIENGILTPERLASYHKLVRETEGLARRERSKGKDSAEVKSIHRAIREIPRRKRLSGF